MGAGVKLMIKDWPVICNEAKYLTGEALVIVAQYLQATV